MKDSSPFPSDTDSLITIRLSPLNYLIHFNEKGIADGFSTVNGAIELNQFLLWARGDHQEIPYRIKYNEGYPGMEIPILPGLVISPHPVCMNLNLFADDFYILRGIDHVLSYHQDHLFCIY